MSIDKYISLVKHEIRIVNTDGETICVIPPSGKIVRAPTAHINKRTENGIPVCEMAYGRITNLPDQRSGVRLIVSAICAQRILQENPSRSDLYSVDGQIRDEHGLVHGCAGLIHW